MRRHSECVHDSPGSAFHFSRICEREKGRQLDPATLSKIALAMTEESARPESDIPSGYTYLGQFVAHDLSFDPRRLGDAGVPDSQMEQRRSPSLDLDSLYGLGPGEQPCFYDDGVHLRRESTSPVVDRLEEAFKRFDLPRPPGGGADIPDPRNDENLVVAQTHVAFIRFHNKVVDTLAGERVPETEVFSRAREEVVRHYQWMLRHDLLPKLVDGDLLDAVFTSPHGRKVVDPDPGPGSPTMPLEFSVAAFRLGHSMVRDVYDLSRGVQGAELGMLFQLTGAPGETIAGRETLPSRWIVDFRNFYAIGGRPPVNRAHRIDTLLSPKLGDLPPGAIAGGPEGVDPILRNLAFRNLTRAAELDLATGQQMLEWMHDKGLTSLEPLTETQITEGANGAGLGALGDSLASAVRDTPLWFYVLREAELKDGRMTGVGGRLVAETFHRCMEGSRSSFLHHPEWRPRFGRDAAQFDMVDLLLFPFDWQEDRLYPLGDGPGDDQLRPTTA